MIFNTERDLPHLTVYQNAITAKYAAIRKFYHYYLWTCRIIGMSIGVTLFIFNYYKDHFSLYLITDHFLIFVTCFFIGFLVGDKSGFAIAVLLNKDNSTFVRHYKPIDQLFLNEEKYKSEFIMLLHDKNYQQSLLDKLCLLLNNSQDHPEHHKIIETVNQLHKACEEYAIDKVFDIILCNYFIWDRISKEIINISKQ